MLISVPIPACNVLNVYKLDTGAWVIKPVVTIGSTLISVYEKGFPGVPEAVTK